ncbi:hypothetical protein F5890DRAFT_1556367 [Lentinula detonsa]|uniref:Uncharacterized protein n=1 Tax=Lentinula detonsa TaxID=2804962 RepID=A0AA38PUK4_9AGAR|nr:hypothetical protein F5890DRAFT_1556367 [Lentinula detonsa]
MFTPHPKPPDSYTPSYTKPKKRQLMGWLQLSSTWATTVDHTGQKHWTGVRLAWEEHRISSWVNHRKIIADLQTFLESRAQWSPSIYDNPPKADPAFDDDHRRGSTLREEIEGATLQYPTARKSSAFITRPEALSKRLRLRGDPASSNSTFPRPTHPLFPQQSVFNESLTQTLSFEIKTTTELVRNAESLAMKYRVSYDAVSHVETLNEAVLALTVVFESILVRLENGISSSEGRHSVFIALLPSLLDELARADQATSDLVRQVPAALLHVDFPGVDQEFKSNASAKLLGLIALRERAQWENEVMGLVSRDLEVVRCEVADEMDRRRWRQDTTSVNGAPLTPESPSAVPLPTHSFQRFIEQLELQMSQLGARMDKGVDDPLASLLETLETPLKEHLSHSARNLKSHFARVKRITDLLQSIHKQTSTMDVIREEFNALQLRIHDVIIRYESKTEDVLGNKSVDEQVVSDTDEAMSSDFSAARSDAMVFVNSLTQRVPLVGLLSQVPSVRRSFSMIDLASATHASSEFTIELAFDLHAIDDAVRADCNSYTMRLNGQVHNLEQKSDIYHLSRIAKELDASTSVLLTEVDHAVVQISTLRDTFDRLGATESLEKLVFDIDQASSTHRNRLNRSLSITREISRRLESAPGILDSNVHERVRRLESAPGILDSNVHERVLLPRTKGIGELEGRITSWEASNESLCARVVAAQEAEVLRLKQEKEAEAAHLAAERDRIAREEAERAQLEKARQEKEERQRLEEARLAEEARLRQEEEERAISGNPGQAVEFNIDVHVQSQRT